MKILFVYPSTLDNNGSPVKYKKGFLPPLSLAILDSLTPSCHQVQIVNDLVEHIDFSVKYDLVAITSMTTQVARAYQIADKFRENGVKVILGGMHPTVMSEEAKLHADAVVVGEADDLWEGILEDCQAGLLKDVYRASSVPDLKRHIIPKWDNMNLNIYPKPRWQKFPKMPIFTTRGCPFGCKFCSVTKYFGKNYRMKPIHHVLEEIDSTRANDYTFVDDNIACNPEYNRELFRELSKKNITWFSQISTRVLKNPDLLQLASRSGCTSLFVGVESINNSNLESVNKGFNDVHSYEELIRKMREAKIEPFLSFIFGFDYDTPEQFEQTFKFLKRNNIGFASFWILTPLPGTELFLEMKENGRINNDDWSTYDLSHVIFQPKFFTEKELLSLYWKYYQDLFSYKRLPAAFLQSLRVSRNRFSGSMQCLFYFSYYRNKVRMYEHPFSGGIGRIR